MHLTGALRILATIILVTSSSTEAFEVACRGSNGTVLSLNIPSNVSFEQAIEEIHYQLDEPEPYQPREYLLDFMAKATPQPKALKEKGPPRVYKVQLNEHEKKQIDYIVSTLGSSSLLAIAKSRSELKKAGEQIERIHPFRFLEHIFGDEKLRAALQNMSKRSWVWKEFFDGIKRSLEEEIARNNLLNHLPTFSSKIQVSPNVIAPLLQEKKWKEFLNVLFEQKPRAGDYDRYDM